MTLKNLLYNLLYVTYAMDNNLYEEERHELYLIWESIKDMKINIGKKKTFYEPSFDTHFWTVFIGDTLKQLNNLSLLITKIQDKVGTNPSPMLLNSCVHEVYSLLEYFIKERKRYFLIKTENISDLEDKITEFSNHLLKINKFILELGKDLLKDYIHRAPRSVNLLLEEIHWITLLKKRTHDNKYSLIIEEFISSVFDIYGNIINKKEEIKTYFKTYFENPGHYYVFVVRQAFNSCAPFVEKDYVLKPNQKEGIIGIAEWAKEVTTEMPEKILSFETKKQNHEIFDFFKKSIDIKS